MDGMSREDAARIGGMDRQTLRDWVHRFNEDGPNGLMAAPCRARRRNRRPNWRKSSRCDRTGRLTAWWAGGASICSASSRIVSASPITSATWASC
ncbi:MAG: helix-turn-helix domain-containing protein [Mesorhizobium sp.]|nr:MAG: helix-turn-helix domain-containing protein [Mesorhizobium sp.]